MDLDDRLLLYKGNRELYILLIATLLVISSVVYYVEIHSEISSTKQTEIKNPEAATSGELHNN